MAHPCGRPCLQEGPPPDPLNEPWLAVSRRQHATRMQEVLTCVEVHGGRHGTVCSWFGGLGLVLRMKKQLFKQKRSQVQSCLQFNMCGPLTLNFSGGYHIIGVHLHRIFITTLSRSSGPAEVSHQMKYIDTSFHLFHELVRRTEVLVAGDVRCPLGRLGWTL